MKVYITKYALTDGISEVEVDLNETTPSSVSYKLAGYWVFVSKPYWHEDIKDAIAHAEILKNKKIASLEKQINKLNKLTFTKEKVK